MRAERDPTETDKGNDGTCHRNSQHATAPALDRRDDKQGKLPVKQRRPNGMTAGKTVTRPIDEPAVHKSTMTEHQHFHALVQEHSTRHRTKHNYKPQTPALQNKKQHRDGQDKPIPFTADT